MGEKLVKLSVSVESDVVEWIDKEIEKRVYRNRSHAIDERNGAGFDRSGMDIVCAFL